MHILLYFYSLLRILFYIINYLSQRNTNVINEIIQRLKNNKVQGTQDLSFLKEALRFCINLHLPNVRIYYADAGVRRLPVSF